MGDQDPNAAPPAAAEGANAPTRQPETIPKPRFDQVNEERKAAQARVAELEAQLASRSPAPAATTPNPAPGPAQQPPPPAPRDDRRIDRTELMVARGIGREAADAVLDYTSKGLSEQDAVDFVRSKRPELFGADRRGHNATTHHVSPPAAGSPTPPSAEPPVKTPFQEIDEVRKKDLHRASRMAVRGASQYIREQMFPGSTRKQ